MTNKTDLKRQVSFSGKYQSKNDDIRIKDEVVNEPVSTTNGDITVKKAEINSSINATNGDIGVNNSQVKGNVFTTNGDIIADTSKIIGDVESKNGEISLINSEIEGVTKTTPKALELKGKNILKDLILQEENAGGSINISGSNIHIGSGCSGTAIINGQRIDLSKLSGLSGESEAKALEFTLPKGNKITGMLKFDSKKPGVLLLEEGAEFVGRLINGTLKHLRL